MEVQGRGPVSYKYSSTVAVVGDGTVSGRVLSYSTVVQ